MDESKPAQMKLEMFLQNKLIDSIPLNAVQLNQPGYIHGLRMQMEERNEDILDLSQEKPEFFIDSVPSSMNATTRLFSN